jgi:hypothetical protein
VQRIFYCAGSTFVTGDRIASAVLGYAAALMQTGEVDVVEIPIRWDDGSSGRSTVLLGPVTQISAQTLAGSRPGPADDDLLDEVLVERLRERTAHLLTPHPPAYDLNPVRVLEDMDY